MYSATCANLPRLVVADFLPKLFLAGQVSSAFIHTFEIFRKLSSHGHGLQGVQVIVGGGFPLILRDSEGTQLALSQWNTYLEDLSWEQLEKNGKSSTKYRRYI